MFVLERMAKCLKPSTGWFLLLFLGVVVLVFDGDVLVVSRMDWSTVRNPSGTVREKLDLKRVDIEPGDILRKDQTRTPRPVQEKLDSGIKERVDIEPSDRIGQDQAKTPSPEQKKLDSGEEREDTEPRDIRREDQAKEQAKDEELEQRKRTYLQIKNILEAKVALQKTTPSNHSSNSTNEDRANRTMSTPVDTRARNSSSSGKDVKLKRILLWTRRYNMTFWKKPQWGQYPFKSENCAYDKCHLTDDRSSLADADVVYFDYNDPPEWPEKRYSHQLYVHRMSERPGKWHAFLGEYEHKINVTLSYRTDSDISLFQPSFRPLDSPREGQYVPKYPLHKRRHAVVWPVSNCNSDSKRELYVNELSKYIDVHIYGKCGNYTCSREDRDTCFDKFQANYKFYLSFENAYCRDYVTEKLSLPLQHELIPVVMGSANYSALTPPHSIINVQDYDTPKDLAAYLNYLSAHEDEYLEYFAWKQTHGSTPHKRIVCLLCEVALDPRYSRPAHSDYNDWWFGGCDNNATLRMLRDGHW